MGARKKISPFSEAFWALFAMDSSMGSEVE